MAIDSIKQYHTTTIHPSAECIFESLMYSSFKDTKVVILGEKPYIGAHTGLAFSILPKEEITPTLMVIFKELNQEFGYKMPNNGNLVPWAKQGVLLLNSTILVDNEKTKSGIKQGWDKLIDHIITLLSNREDPCVFMLWGKDAINKSNLIDKNKNLVLTATNPSPLYGDGFIGCNHFTKCNQFLNANNRSEINWQI